MKKNPRIKLKLLIKVDSKKGNVNYNMNLVSMFKKRGFYNLNKYIYNNYYYIISKFDNHFT